MFAHVYHDNNFCTRWSGSNINIRLSIDEAGRVIIPEGLREELHLEPGDALEMETAGDRITLRPVRGTGSLTREDGVWVFRAGRHVPASVTDELLHRIRKERDLVALGNQE